MKKSAMLLMLSLCANAASAQVYAPAERATTFTAGKQYMIFNTAYWVEKNQDRTGLLFDNGSGYGHSGAGVNIKSYTTTDKKYLWEITPSSNTQADAKGCVFHIKSVSTGKYAGPMGATNNANPVDVFIQPWTTSKVNKAGVHSINDNGTKTAAAEITEANKVFTVSSAMTSSGQNCWNGNPGSWSKWGNAHPYAFYTVKEVRTKQDLETYSAAASKVNPMGVQTLYGVKDQAKYTSNAKSSQEGSYAALIDGDENTYFHSEYSKLVGAPHYLQVELANAATEFAFYFKKRKQNHNNRPTAIKIEGSNDNKTFTEIKTINQGLPTAANVVDYYSEKITSQTAYKYIRFTVTATNNGAKDGQQATGAQESQKNVFFTFSEFYVVSNADAIEYFTTKRAMDLAFYDYTGKTSTEVTAAINAFNAANDKQALPMKKAEYTNKLAAYNGHIGTDINKYDANAWKDIVALNNTLQSATTLEQATQNGAAIDAALKKLQMNQPIAGRFYRLRCTSGNKYLTKDYDANLKARLHMENNKGKAVLLYRAQDKSMLAFNNGQYFGNAGGNNDFAYCAVGATPQANILDNGSALGSYGVKLGNRYLYGARDYTDSGTGRNNDAGYNWWLEQVEALPVTVTAAGWASLYAPVALTIPANVKVYTAQKEGNYLKLTAVQTTIPANTPVLVEAAANTYNFTINYEDNTPAISSSLKGALQTTVATTVADVFTLQQQNNVVGFYPYNGTNLQGFRAYGVSLLDAQAAAGLTFVFDGETTGIEGVAGNNNKQQVIYDLSGRRVLKAQKGLYIVNGKKVMIR